MSGLETIYNTLMNFTGWLWGLPVLIMLIGGGLVLAYIIRGVQFRKIGFVCKNTLGVMFKKSNVEGVSSAQAAIAALGGTIGTGNIVGVGVAIAMGGPGALFWMWVCGFIAMGIKYAETTLAVAYRQKSSTFEGYRSGPFMYIKDGLKCKPLAYVVALLSILSGLIIGGVHGSAVAGNLDLIGISRPITCLIVVAFAAVILIGGMKWMVKITDKMVPFMSLFYIVCVIIVVVMNFSNIGNVFASIFKGAFTGQAAVGGFGGATLRMAIRWGLARGVFSNDAGLGLSGSIHAQADGIKMPAQQGMWAIFEVFVDTIVVCSLTGFLVLFSGIWQTGESGDTLAALALQNNLGAFGKYGCIFALALFTISSLLAAVESTKILLGTVFKSTVAQRAVQVVQMGMIIAGCLFHIEIVFGFADLASGIVLMLHIPVMIILGKKLREMTDDWFYKKTV